jgi:hypothetical protein
MTEKRPKVLRKVPGKIPLNFHGVCVPAQPQPARQSPDMRVYDHAVIDPKCISQHYICSFSSDTGECRKRLHVPWHFSLVAIDDLSRRGLNILGLGSVETCRVNDRFEFRYRNLCKILNVTASLEQVSCDNIDALIRALCREDSRD